MDASRINDGTSAQLPSQSETKAPGEAPSSSGNPSAGSAIPSELQGLSRPHSPGGSLRPRSPVGVVQTVGTLETSGPSPEVIEALKNGEDPQAIIRRLRLNPYSGAAYAIKDKAYAIKQEKIKVAEEKIEKMKTKYPDNWDNRVFVGRSAEYDPPAAALKRGGKLEDVIKEFGFENDPEETARLTKLVNGGQERNDMWQN
jgi:hypothetical protein